MIGGNSSSTDTVVIATGHSYNKSTRNGDSAIRIYARKENVVRRLHGKYDAFNYANVARYRVQFGETNSGSGLGVTSTSPAPTASTIPSINLRMNKNPCKWK